MDKEFINALLTFPNKWSWKKLKLKSFSPVWLFATPWTAAHQAPLSMAFSRQEYWSGLPFPSIFLTQGLNPGLTHCRQTLYHLSHKGSLNKPALRKLHVEILKEARLYFWMFTPKSDTKKKKNEGHTKQYPDTSWWLHNGICYQEQKQITHLQLAHTHRNTG